MGGPALHLFGPDSVFGSFCCLGFDFRSFGLGLPIPLVLDPEKTGRGLKTGLFDHGLAGFLRHSFFSFPDCFLKKVFYQGPIRFWRLLTVLVNIKAGWDKDGF